MTLVAVVVVALAIACRSRDATPSSGGGPISGRPGLADVATSAATRAELVGPDELRGAIPAWQAVVDRSRYLERRGGSGVVQGVVGAAEPPLVWLVDETEGNGSLAIRVALPPHTTATPGDRMAVAGAWRLDDSRDWIWHARAVTVLPTKSEGALNVTAARFGHSIVDGEIPVGARPISTARQGEVAYFAVVGSPPVVDGDGWLVADTARSRPYALLNLPGERPSFGGQDFRSRAERWSIERGETYWVRIGPVRRRGADPLATMNARTAPVHVPRPAIQTDR